MPYRYQQGLDAAATGVPLMRPMVLEFPDDPAVAYLDRQYMLGSNLLVAPVFSADGSVDFYLPAGEWTSLLTGETVIGGGWRRETHDFDSLPLYVRPGTALPWGARVDNPEYDYHDGLELRVFPGATGIGSVTVTGGRAETYSVGLEEITG